MRRLCQENAWLRDELASTQHKLQSSEQSVAQLEEDKKHLEFMNSMKKYESEVTEQQGDDTQETSGAPGEKAKKEVDPAADLFPDDDQDERISGSPTPPSQFAQVRLTTTTPLLLFLEHTVYVLLQIFRESWTVSNRNRKLISYSQSIRVPWILADPVGQLKVGFQLWKSL